MIVVNPQMRAWLAHRYGNERLPSSFSFGYVTKALELNQKGPSFIETQGKRKFNSFVGFVDLAGFSTRVSGKPPEAVAAYAKRFLEGVIGIVSERSGLVDKTIGDEVMFALPEPEENGGPPSNLLMGQMLGGLHDLAFQLASDYRFRISLSWGEVALEQIEGVGFAEWSLFGEPVHVAKRISGLECLSSPNPVHGAFGLKADVDPEKARESVKGRMAIIAGVASKWKSTISEEFQNLKGVGKVSFGYFQPRCK